MADNLLEVKNLNLGFRVEDTFRQALYDVSFTLKRGKMLSLVGESGCGKTMSAMSILRLLPKTAQITSGEILYYGDDILKKDIKEMRYIRGGKIALIPQDPMTSLNPLYTVGNQLLEVIKIHQKLEGEEAEKKALEAFDMVKIPDAKSRLKNYPHEFSGGMKQRAIIAMALACNAEIIIADEPTTALDVTIQAQIMNILGDIKRDNNVSILLITHDLALVSENSDDICVMYAGRIVERAPKDEFFAYPNHPYTKALLKSIPSNNNYVMLESIKGQPPTLSQNIDGCKFHPRCNFCTEKCKTKIPQSVEVSENHYSSCWLNSI